MIASDPSSEARDAVADALFLDYQPDMPLSGSRQRALEDALATVSLAGLDEETIVPAIAASRVPAPERSSDWRSTFWRQVLTLAGRRAAAASSQCSPGRRERS